MDSPHKEAVMQKTFPCHDVAIAASDRTQHVVGTPSLPHNIFVVLSFHTLAQDAYNGTKKWSFPNGGAEAALEIDNSSEKKC